MVARKFLALLLFYLVAHCGWAAEESSLVSRNPFGREPVSQTPPPPPPRPTPPAVQLASEYEWIGYYKLNDMERFSLRDRSTGNSIWLNLGETKEGLTVLSYDFSKREIQLRRGTTFGVIPLKSTDYSLGIPNSRNLNPSPAASNRDDPLVRALTPGTNPNQPNPPVRRRIIVPPRADPAQRTTE
ncbi:MAG: hypothetical protein ACFCU4_09500 [Puniceicoccaceae bacterium]